MPPIGVWGPTTWNFFHTLAEKIHEDDFPKIGPQLLLLIKRICRYLPCPDCSNHATLFFQRTTPDAFSTKEKMKTGLYILHNAVNRRKNKVIAKRTILDMYKSHNVIRAFNRFIQVYHTRGNMRLLTDTFQRQLIIKDIRKWLITNIKSFT